MVLVNYVCFDWVIVAFLVCFVQTQCLLCCGGSSACCLLRHNLVCLSLSIFHMLFRAQEEQRAQTGRRKTTGWAGVTSQTTRPSGTATTPARSAVSTWANASSFELACVSQYVECTFLSTSCRLTKLVTGSSLKQIVADTSEFTSVVNGLSAFGRSWWERVNHAGIGHADIPPLLILVSLTSLVSCSSCFRGYHPWLRTTATSHWGVFSKQLFCSVSVCNEIIHGICSVCLCACHFPQKWAGGCSSRRCHLQDDCRQAAGRRQELHRHVGFEVQMQMPSL